MTSHVVQKENIRILLRHLKLTLYCSNDSFDRYRLGDSGSGDFNRIFMASSARKEPIWEETIGSRRYGNYCTVGVEQVCVNAQGAHSIYTKMLKWPTVFVSNIACILLLLYCIAFFLQRRKTVHQLLSITDVYCKFCICCFLEERHFKYRFFVWAFLGMLVSSLLPPYSSK